LNLAFDPPCLGFHGTTNSQHRKLRTEIFKTAEVLRPARLALAE